MKRKPKGEIVSARQSLQRDVLPPEHAEPPIKPLWIDWNLGDETADWNLGVKTAVWSGEVIKLSINLQTIKRESAEHHDIIYALLKLLDEQANVARNAVTVAAENLQAVKRLKDQKDDAIAGRVKQAALEREKLDPYVRSLQSEADRLRKADPTKSVADIRAALKLKKVPGVTGRMIRGVKVAPARKKLPRPKGSR